MGVPPKFWNFRYSQAISYLVTSETQLQPHYGAVSKITENVGEEMSMYAPTRPAMIQSNTYFRSHSLQICIQKLPLRILDMHGNKCRDIILATKTRTLLFGQFQKYCTEKVQDVEIAEKAVYF